MRKYLARGQDVRTERTRIDHYAFLARPYAFFRPYHLTGTPLTRDIFLYGFSKKLRSGPFDKHVTFTFIFILSDFS